MSFRKFHAKAAASPEFKKAYYHHLTRLQASTEKILAELALDQLVIGAGTPHYYAEDDATAPFRTYHHFTHWCPLQGEGHLLVIRPGRKPVLHYFSPVDYWHEHATIGDEYWTDGFDIQAAGDEAGIWRAVAGLKNAAYMGAELERANQHGLKTSVSGLKPRLDWERSFKSDYEIMATAEASRSAAIGHKAAHQAFLAGGSELDIHVAYLGAIRATEHDLPYEAIVGLDEKCAVLHYRNKRDGVKGHTMLIDSGDRFVGYASDITRTYAAPSAHPVFKALVTGMNDLQLTTAAAVKPNTPFETLHALSHVKLGELLLKTGILRGVSATDAAEREMTAPFFPHGLGHQLGIFVHDVAGKQLDRLGTESKPNPKWKYLRTNRVLAERCLVTIEPGLYFIDSLLAPCKAGPERAHFDWPLIEALTPMGGIRIEDDVVVTATGHRNLTREFLP